MRLPGAVVWMEIISETKLKDSSGGDSFCFKTLFTKNMCVYRLVYFCSDYLHQEGFPTSVLFVCLFCLICWLCFRSIKCVKMVENAYHYFPITKSTYSYSLQTSVHYHKHNKSKQIWTFACFCCVHDSELRFAMNMRFKKVESNNLGNLINWLWWLWWFSLFLLNLTMIRWLPYPDLDGPIVSSILHICIKNKKKSVVLNFVHLRAEGFDRHFQWKKNSWCGLYQTSMFP